MKPNLDAQILQFAFGSAGMGLWDVTLVEPWTVVWDDRCKALFGIAKGNAIPYAEAIQSIHDHDREAVDAAVKAALDPAGDGSYNMTYRTLGIDDKQIRWVNFIGKAHFNEEGVPIRFAGIARDLTADKPQYATLDKLAESQEQLRFAIESAELGTWDLNPVTGWFTGNDRLKGWFGLLPEEEIPLALAIEVIAEEDRARVSTAIQMALDYASGGSYDIEFTIRSSPATTKRIVRAKGKAWFRADQTPYRFNGTMQDITEQATGQRKLVESESLFRSFIEKTPVATAVFTGKDLVIAVANQVMLGYWQKGDKVIGMPYRQALPELEGQGYFDILDSIFRTGKDHHAYASRADIVENGRTTTSYFDYSYTPLLTADGTVYAVLNMGTDVTEQVLARQKLEEAATEMQGVVNMTNLATWSFDIRSNTFAYSPRFMKWLGLTEATQAADDAYTSLPEAYRQSVAAKVSESVVTGSYDNEHPIVNRLTGQVRIIHAQANVFYNADGLPLVLRGTAQDITVQRNIQLALEQQVRQRTEELEKSNEALTAANEELEMSNTQLLKSNAELAQYAWVASHDLQEPLRKIRVFSSMLDNDVTLSASQQLYLGKINQSSKRMSLLINDLLTFSRLLNGESVKKPVDLNTVVHGVITDLELTIMEKRAVVEVGHLPEIEAVDLQMNQLFYNLMSNALKFTDPDTLPHIRIDASLIAEKEFLPYIPKPFDFSDYYLIRFTDNGIGFESQYADRIFEIFKRLHPKEVYPGTGIGLSLCRNIVTNHSGYIYATSGKEAGTTFSIILPVRQSP